MLVSERQTLIHPRQTSCFSIQPRASSLILAFTFSAGSSHPFSWTPGKCPPAALWERSVFAQDVIGVGDRNRLGCSCCGFLRRTGRGRSSSRERSDGAAVFSTASQQIDSEAECQPTHGLRDERGCPREQEPRSPQQAEWWEAAEIAADEVVWTEAAVLDGALAGVSLLSPDWQAALAVSGYVSGQPEPASTVRRDSAVASRCSRGTCARSSATGNEDKKKRRATQRSKKNTKSHDEHSSHWKAQRATSQKKKKTGHYQHVVIGQGLDIRGCIGLAVVLPHLRDSSTLQLRNVVLAIHRNRVMKVTPQQLLPASEARKDPASNGLHNSKTLVQQNGKTSQSSSDMWKT